LLKAKGLFVLAPTFWCIKMKIKIIKNQKGLSLIETAAAVVILGIISVAFLSALATTSTARATNEERTSAKILAESIIENIKTDTYSVEYEPVIPPEFPGYTANVTATNERNGNIQKITVTITYKDHEVLTLESYKVDRSS
jgi:prepilin-type N-terminal cleavage/methylation domain-containing protein